MEKGRGLFFLTLLSCFPCLLSFPANHKKTKNKNKNKNNFFFPHNGVRSWLAYPESIRFQVFSLFFICRGLTRCTTKSIRSQEDKKNPLLFLIRCDHARCTAKSIHSQGRQQSETKTNKKSNNKTDKI